jgi:hypothetical protein
MTEFPSTVKSWDQMTGADETGDGNRNRANPSDDPAISKHWLTI